MKILIAINCIFVLLNVLIYSRRITSLENNNRANETQASLTKISSSSLEPAGIRAPNHSVVQDVVQVTASEWLSIFSRYTTDAGTLVSLLADSFQLSMQQRKDCRQVFKKYQEVRAEIPVVSATANTFIIRFEKAPHYDQIFESMLQELSSVSSTDAKVASLSEFIRTTGMLPKSQVGFELHADLDLKNNSVVFTKLNQLKQVVDFTRMPINDSLLNSAFFLEMNEVPEFRKFLVETIPTLITQ